jgi:HK97 family phage prohead protease
MRRKEQMNSENMEIRAFNFEVRAQEDEEHGTFVEGTPIVYDSWTNLGWYDEMIDRGALADTDLRDVRFLVNHNTDMIPLARSRNNNENSTMQMSIDDEVGMKIRVNLDTENNAEAKALYSAIERGDISGMSFMFTVDGDRWEDETSEHPKRHIERISKVFEVSAVTFPAYEATNISARGLADVLDNAKASLESVRAEKRAIELLKAKIRILSEV